MTATHEPHVREIPLSDIGLATHEGRQIRPVREEDVERLLAEADPTSWAPIEVRPWPDGEAYPPGEQGRTYQVIAGYHRVTAARRIGLPTIRAIIRADVPDDTTFLLEALKSNLRHGKRMTREEIVAVARPLSATMSLLDLSKRLGIPKGTLQTWLSGRDQNAAAKAKQAALQASSERQEESDRATLQASSDLRFVVEPSRDKKAIAAVGAAWSDLCVDGSIWDTPPDVIAGWLESLLPDQRVHVAADVARARRWLQGVQAALGAPDTEDMEAAG